MTCEDCKLLKTEINDLKEKLKVWARINENNNLFKMVDNRKSIMDYLNDVEILDNDSIEEIKREIEINQKELLNKDSDGLGYELIVNGIRRNEKRIKNCRERTYLAQEIKREFTSKKLHGSYGK